MNKIIIAKINIKDFCGIKSYETTLDNEYQKFIAKNGSGKTSITKAIMWVLGFNVSNFYPTKDHREIKDLVPMVEIELLINNISYIFKKEYITKYVFNEELNEMVKKNAISKYYIDNMELKTEKVYKERLTELFGLESYDFLERCINKDFFNTDTTKWKWTNRRKMILDICQVEDVNNQILDNINKYNLIKDFIIKGYAISDIQSMFKKDKKDFVSKQKANLVLIEQKEKELAELLELDFNSINTELEQKQAELDNLVKSSNEELSTNKLKELQNQLFEMQSKLAKAEIKDNNRLQKIKNENMANYIKLQDIYFNIGKLKSEVEILEENFTLFDKDLEQSEFCHTCGQKLPIEKIEEIKNNIETKKAINKNDIKNCNAELYILKIDYNNLKKEYDTKKAEIDNFTESEEIKDIKNCIKHIEIDIKQAKQSSLIETSNEKETLLKNEIIALNIQSGKEEDLLKFKTYIAMWKNENTEITDKITEICQKEKQLNDFAKEQCNLIEDKVNSFFGNNITFSLFNIINNNGEPKIDLDCEIMWDGKTYSNMSNGEKLFTNLRICEKIQSYYGINFPIFIDNAESITEKINSNRQLICLYAKENKTIDNLIKI